jgi:sugar/nucleoside kinase (ribokinase family)
VARYLTLGHLLVEDTLLPDGGILAGCLGGDAVYAANGARVWDDDVIPVARIGNDFPPELLEQLQAVGYDEGFIPCPHRTIRLWVRWGVEGPSRFTFREGVGSYEDFTPLPEEIPPSYALGLDAVHIAPIPLRPLGELVAWARSRARIVTVDPHYEHVSANVDEWRRILPSVDVFLPSRQEASDLLGSWPGAEAAARELAQLGAAVVCVKLGGDGALAFRAADDHVARVRAAAVRAVDPTGCGDAFSGGFLVGWAESGELETALAYGTVSASFAAEDYGAARSLTVDRREARRRLAQVRGS